MKRSRYFFLRRQAEKRAQAYSLASILLILGSTVTSVFAFQAPVDNTIRVAVLSNAKPPSDEIIAAVRPLASVAASELAPIEVVTAPRPRLAAELPVEQAVEEQAVEEPVVELAVELELAPAVEEKMVSLPELAVAKEAALSEIGALLFSTEIGPSNQPLNVGSIFAEGFYTLYATFDYADMLDGTEWSWIWLRNGDAFDGGKELWNYGQRGQGYIYLNPVDGFTNGEYELEVWVEGDLVSQSSLTVNSAAVTAGN